MKIIFESVSGITWESRDTRIVNFTRRQKLQDGDSGGYLKQVIPQGGRFDLDVEDGSTIFAGRMKRDSTVLEVAASMVLPRGGVVTVESRECAVFVITSYSIHYTKLYEQKAAPRCGPVAKRGR